MRILTTRSNIEKSNTQQADRNLTFTIYLILLWPNHSDLFKINNNSNKNTKSWLVNMALIEFLQGVSVAIVNHWQTILIPSIFMLVLYSLVSSRSMKTWYGENIRGPKPLPVLGHLVDTIKHKGQLHLQVHEYFLKYGKVFAMSSFLGKIPNLVIADPEMLKDIFVKEFDSFRDRPVSYMFVNLINRTRYDTFARINTIFKTEF